jgi:transcriptional regulator GlxA family with amidase domain
MGMRQARIERANELLVTTSISITRIGGMCGYVNPTQFGETFKRSTGKTPSEYRTSSKTKRLKKRDRRS